MELERDEDFYLFFPFLIIVLLFKWVWWNLRGRPYIKYKFFYCDKCGRQWNEPFEVSKLLSLGEKMDKMRVCPEGKGCQFISCLRSEEFIEEENV